MKAVRFCKLILVVGAVLPTLLLAPSCSKWEGETVESSYMIPLVPDPEYSFKRNGSSSVDYRETTLVSEPLDNLYNVYLKPARMLYQDTYDLGKSYFNEGEFGVSPREVFCQSALHRDSRETLLAEADRLIELSAKLSGYPNLSPGTVRNHRASQGQLGFIGENIGDDNIFFVDEAGIAPAEVFRGLMMGGIYIDKVLNIHLEESLYQDSKLRQDHEHLVLPAGHNYTVLEHHWDLAYGYYQFLLGYVDSQGLPILKQSRQKLYNAFAIGRLALVEFRYDELLAQIPIIRAELSKVLAVRAMHQLVSENTLVNLKESPEEAMIFISEGCGLIYSLLFTRQPDGKPYISLTEVERLIAKLRSGQGLWDAQKLLGGEESEGSLKNIAAAIGQYYGIKLEAIRRSNG